MNKAVRNCVEKCNISLEEAFRMAGMYPAKVLNLDSKVGKIDPGFTADLVLLTEDVEVIGCV